MNKHEIVKRISLSLVSGLAISFGYIIATVDPIASNLASHTYTSTPSGDIYQYSLKLVGKFYDYRIALGIGTLVTLATYLILRRVKP